MINHKSAPITCWQWLWLHTSAKLVTSFWVHPYRRIFPIRAPKQKNSCTRSSNFWQIMRLCMWNHKIVLSLWTCFDVLKSSTPRFQSPMSPNSPCDGERDLKDRNGRCWSCRPFSLWGSFAFLSGSARWRMLWEKSCRCVDHLLPERSCQYQKSYGKSFK